MVEVTFRRGDFGYFGYSAREHAGDPLVCSAVSILSMTLIGYLKSCVGIETTANYMPGYVEVEMLPSMEEEIREKTDIIWSVIHFGLKQLEASYPDKVRIQEKN